MRFVPIKTDDQLDLQSLHLVREQWVVRRTALINQIRSMLLDCGITVGKGAPPHRTVDARIPTV
jgi:transposase